MSLVDAEEPRGLVVMLEGTGHWSPVHAFEREKGTGSQGFEIAEGVGNEPR